MGPHDTSNPNEPNTQAQPGLAYLRKTENPGQVHLIAFDLQ